MTQIDTPEATECPECSGAGTVEITRFPAGTREVRCQADGCDDGIVR